MDVTEKKQGDKIDEQNEERSDTKVRMERRSVDNKKKITTLNFEAMNQWKLRTQYVAIIISEWNI